MPAHHDNPYDGATLKPALAQVQRLSGIQPLKVLVDQGFRGQEHHPLDVQILICDKRKRTASLKRLIAAILVAITAWHGIIRVRDPLKVPAVYLGAATFLMCLVCLQIYLGNLVDWVYGLHTVPVVEAAKQGLLK